MWSLIHPYFSKHQYFGSLPKDYSLAGHDTSGHQVVACLGSPTTFFGYNNDNNTSMTVYMQVVVWTHAFSSPTHISRHEITWLNDNSVYCHLGSHQPVLNDYVTFSIP